MFEAPTQVQRPENGHPYESSAVSLSISHLDPPYLHSLLSKVNKIPPVRIPRHPPPDTLSPKNTPHCSVSINCLLRVPRAFSFSPIGDEDIAVFTILLEAHRYLVYVSKTADAV